jgi:hypothetical protein
VLVKIALRRDLGNGGIKKIIGTILDSQSDYLLV